MDLGLLTVPLISLLVAFGFAVLTDTQTVHFEYIDVPHHISEETGYTSAVVITKLADEMQQIERQARSAAHARQVDTHVDSKPTAVLGEFLGVTPLIRVVQESAALIPFTFSGEMVMSGHDVEFTLRGYDASHGMTRIVRHANAEDMRGLIRATAFEAMRVVDPYILAAYQFKRDRLNRDFTPTLEIIRRELDKHDSKYAQWMHNLWGMVLYQQADRQGAIAQFKEAAQINPKFLSPLLNWGVVLARLGNHEEAIAKFREVVLKGSGANATATVAAAYSEWGFSLALSDHFEDAISKFEKAAETDPTFADVYSSWADVLSAQGRSDEAAQMTQRALKLAPKEVIQTENLIGAVQNVPASASVE